MNDSKLKEELCKTIKLVENYRQDEKYLLYFSNDYLNKSDLNMMVTNGCMVWKCKLTDDTFLKEKLIKTSSASSSHSFAEFARSMLDLIRRDQFELNTQYKTSADKFDDQEAIEFRSCVDVKQSTILDPNFKFILEPAKSYARELKFLLFSMHAKLTQTELELGKLSKYSTNIQLIDSSICSSQTSNNSADLLKNFNVSAQKNVVRRTQGMSIINPLSKRRKTPQGVKFDEDDDQEQSTASQDN
jgi:hypothetical protein